MSTATLKTTGTYVTPHCQNGGHENAKVLSPGGALMPSCRGEYNYRYLNVTCFCWCHEMFRTMRDQQAAAVSEEEDGTPGTDTPATVALAPLQPVITGGPPSADTAPTEEKLDFYGEATGDSSLSPQVRRFINKHVFGLDMSDAPDLTDKRYDEGKRRARGSLDINVEAVCRLWLDRKLPYEMLTPSDIAMIIDVSNPPSPGAIHAVLTRWAEGGLCMVGSKPVRFIGFSPTVDERGISFMKGALQREKKARSNGFF